MNLLELFTDYSWLTISLLIIFSFTAGFIDAVVGGGGLIQLPALLVNLSNTSLPVLFGTNKIAALAGTSVSAYQYSKRIHYNYKLLITISVFAFTSSYLGAQLFNYIDSAKLKPIIFIILIVIAAYTFLNKNLGSVQSKTLSVNKQLIFGSLIGIVVGFYDGFFGPGTGSFLVLGFVVILGFEFVNASAYAKMVNCMTNLSALIVFISKGNYLPGIALLMAASNISGNMLGAAAAIKKGNTFVRNIFLVVVSLMILKYGYDIFLKTA